MSEKHGPFDAAIKELEENVFAVTNFLRGCDENNHFPEFIVSQKKRLLELQLAIRVLEAAGKIVDRRNEVLECLNAITPSNDGRVNYIYNSVRGLLESLPERGEQ